MELQRPEQKGPHIYQLANNGSNIIVVMEHTVAIQIPSAESGPPLLYCRGLDKDSSLTRGVGLMWRNTLNANPYSSDRIC